MFYFGVEKVDKFECDFRALRSQYHAQFNSSKSIPTPQCPLNF
jgi:hypothetical protein